MAVLSMEECWCVLFSFVTDHFSPTSIQSTLVQLFLLSMSWGHGAPSYLTRLPRPFLRQSKYVLPQRVLRVATHNVSPLHSLLTAGLTLQQVGYSTAAGGLPQLCPGPLDRGRGNLHGRVLQAHPCTAVGSNLLNPLSPTGSPHRGASGLTRAN